MRKLAKRVLSAVMAGAISMGGLLAAPVGALAVQAEDFTDLPSQAWYYDYLNRAVGLGLFGGTSASTFSPDRGITRAEAVTVLARVHEKLTGEKPGAVATPVFADVPAGSYYSKAVAWATENGIVSGYGDGTFGPRKTVTHAELAVMFHRYLTMVDKADLYQPSGDAYQDQDAIPAWAESHVQALSGFSIFRESEFAPRAVVLRDEATALFVRMYEKAAYPVDRETPRQKFIYHRALGEDGESYAPLLPLGEEHKKLITTWGEYTEVMAALQNAETCEAVEQPVGLEVSEGTFEESNLAAVEIQLESDPAFDCDFGSVALKGGQATVTLVGKGSSGTAGTGKSLLFLVPVPKSVAQVELQQFHWTDDTFWIPM